MVERLHIQGHPSIYNTALEIEGGPYGPPMANRFSQSPWLIGLNWEEIREKWEETWDI